MKIIVKAVFLFIAVNILGFFIWPYASYLTGCDIGILCYWVSAVVALFGLILFFIAYIRKRSKKKSLWIIMLACAIFSSVWTILNRYGENGNFVGEYIEFSKYEDRKYPNINGLADKFGREFIEPQYDCILKVFSNDKESYIYVGVESHIAKEDSMVDGDETDFYSFILHLHDEDGKLKKIENITESDCDYIKDYIEKHIGKITDEYGYCLHDRMIKTVTQGDLTPKSLTKNSQKAKSEEKNVMPAMGQNDNEKDVKEVVVRHVHEKQQVWKERWKPCISCDRGKCRQCHGQGGYYIGNIYNICTSCNGTGACVWCNGRGEIMETYSTWE